MALEIRPNCELCDKDLKPDSVEARICSYECTFCRDCVDQVLHNVCPNCGGGFSARPVRPSKEWRPGVSLSRQQASNVRKHTSIDREAITAFCDAIKDIAPVDR